MVEVVANTETRSEPGQSLERVRNLGLGRWKAKCEVLRWDRGPLVNCCVFAVGQLWKTALLGEIPIF